MAQYIVFHQRETVGGPLRHLAGEFESLESADAACDAMQGGATGGGFYAIVRADNAAPLHIKR